LIQAQAWGARIAGGGSYFGSRIPSQWKTSKTVLLYTKGDLYDNGNYRTTCLLSIVYKLFTRRLEGEGDEARGGNTNSAVQLAGPLESDDKGRRPASLMAFALGWLSYSQRSRERPRVMSQSGREVDAIDVDIAVEATANRVKRQAFRGPTYPNNIWSDGVYYSFDPNAGSNLRRIFRKAADLWEQDTCINFRKNDTGLCETVHHAVHEIGHALGFYHTQARHDRDTYVTVNVANIEVSGSRASDSLVKFDANIFKRSYRSQYQKQPASKNYNYGLPYDFGSAMHYSMRSGSIGGRPTMIPLDGNYNRTMGSPFISFIDLSMMNEHYQCKEGCKESPSVKCERGGFPHPRNCQKCICPGGYGGTRCHERVRDPEDFFTEMKALRQQFLAAWLWKNRYSFTGMANSQRYHRRTRRFSRRLYEMPLLD
uniref:Metalloendopeptidase n=1 Tax=Heligmosomoides polygyrus TaxID=6339 RepID=A0A8L8KBF5_HELPZ